jgi:hypothetical protein
MKNTIIRKRVVVLATVIAGGITLTSVPFDSKALYSGSKIHACVTVQDSPTHKSVDCIGDGTACADVSDCK